MIRSTTKWLTGTFLPLREIRKCVPEFLWSILFFLNLTVYNTGEMEHSYG